MVERGRLDALKSIPMAAISSADEFALQLTRIDYLLSLYLEYQPTLQ